MLPTAELDYDLPPGRIATHPARPRDAARLLVLARDSGRIQAHGHVRELPTHLRPGDLLVLNSTRVLPARFTGRRADTGGAAEGLYLGPAFNPDGPAEYWSILLKTRRAKPGAVIQLFDHAGWPTPLSLRILQRHSDDPSSTDSGGWTAELVGSDEPATVILHRLGFTPLPPYIRQARKRAHDEGDDAIDRADYQTSFADPDPGRAESVAAPTAGLHFTPELLQSLDSRGVRTARITLHVGMGTFKPIDTQFVEQHPIHAEWCSIPAATINAIRQTRAAGGRVIAVGTTSARTLESFGDALVPSTSGSAEVDAFEGSTRLMITPGHRWRVADGLLTNFHLPRSTLLALVAAMLGPDQSAVARLLAAYKEAIERDYRFYSFGDAMLVI